MDDDVGPGAEAGADAGFGAVGDVVGGEDGEGGIDADVDFDGDAGADAAGAEVVGIVDEGVGGDEAEEFVFGVAREGFFEEFADGGGGKLPGGYGDEDGDGEGGQGVEDGEAFAEKAGAGDAKEGTDGG